MSNSKDTIIKDYEVLFAIRTGVTILVPKVADFDDCKEAEITFEQSNENPADIKIEAKGRKLVLKNMQKNHIEAAISQGFILFYEMNKEDVVRCTRCGYKTA